MMLLLTFILILCTTITLWKWPKKKPGSTLPTPPQHWFLGNILTMIRLDSMPMKAFDYLRTHYGNLFSLNMVRREMVIVSGFDEMKEVLNHESSERKYNLPVVNLILYDEYEQDPKNAGILLNGTTEFKELRRFTLKTLRDLGFGKKQSEKVITEECINLIEEINQRIKQNNGVFDKDELPDLFMKASLNVTWNICTGLYYILH